MTETLYTQNRELSWLRFDERVMEEATEDDVPAFERLKFLAIFTSNLDEFFMIRVGSLYDQTFLPKPQIDNKTGMNAEEQLHEIFQAVAPLYEKRDRIYGDVMRNLQECGITKVSAQQLSRREQDFVREYFFSYIQPILSPQIINAHHPFPHLVNKNLYIVLLLAIDEKTAYGIIPVPVSMSRIVCMPDGNLRYMLLEDVILEYAGEVFDNCKIQAGTVISVTRNADINVSSLIDEDEDFRHQMKKVLKKRSRLAPVRLEFMEELHEKLEKFLRSRLKLKQEQIFCSHAPLEMSYVFSLIDRLPQNVVNRVIYEPFAPQPPDWYTPQISMLQAVLEQDRLLSYPYDQMNPFLQLIREAAEDSRVISIKITIYRLASKATLVDYLRMAAEHGKEVTVLMELRARFDEANNINWSESLEEAGCTVLYGIQDYKVHSKVCQITLMDQGELKRITQVGTGNYNEKTAKLYTDLSLMTADPSIGRDAAEYFRNMSIQNLNGVYRELLVAPNSMKNRILALIQGEIEKARCGAPARILVKINSLTDRDTIDALKEASQAGVQVEMIVRGICCLLPGIEGYTEHISVTSVVGRFLEHSRVYCFGIGKDLQMYISSADFMTRNLNRRVEVACPIKDHKIQEQILEILSLMQEDHLKARRLCADGRYERKLVAEDSPQEEGLKRQPGDCQKELIQRALMPPVHVEEKNLVREKRCEAQNADEPQKTSAKRGIFARLRRWISM